MSRVDNHLIEMHFEKVLKKEEEIQNTANIKKKRRGFNKEMKKEGTKIYIYRERIKNIAISIKKGKIILCANYFERSRFKVLDCN